MANAEVGTAYVTIMPKMDKGFSGDVTSALETTGVEGGSMFGEGMLGTFKGMATKIVAALGLVEVGKKIAEIGQEAYGLYSDYEQLSGGVNKLFGDDAAKLVESNASKAFETAGMSANEYMETVTGFSASLINSLGGDTATAASQADKAIRDMSDNANTFGTDMESIQNAYQGFAKQNYTMLDNLKLGYGGTKEEMQRLLEDAEAISGVHYDIDNYSDVVDAIHTIQEEQHIAGTTANEAAGTVEGSTNAMKSSWANFLTELGKDNADMDAVSKQLADTVVNALKNMAKVAFNIVKNAVKAFPGVVKGFYNALKPLLKDWLGKLKNALSEAWDAIKTAAVKSWENIKTAVADKWDAIKKAVTDKLNAVKTGISTGWDNVKATALAKWEAVKASIVAKWEAIKTAVANALKAVVTAISGGWDSVKTTATSKWEAVKSAIGAKWDAIKSAVDAKLTAVKNAVSAGWDSVKSTATSKWDTVKGAVTAKWDEIKAGVGTRLDGIKSAASTAWDSIKSTASTRWGAIKGAITDAIGSAKSSFSTKVGEMKSLVANFKPTFSKIAAPAIGSISGVLSSMRQSITNFRPSFSKIAAPAIGSISGVLDSMKQSISNFKPTFSKIAAPVVGSISGALDTISQAVSNFMPSFPKISWPTPSMPHIPTPHFSLSWNSILGGIVKVPSVSFDGWWRTGGFFDEPSVIGVGEAGPEMVLPQRGRLMDDFADAIASKVGGGVIVTGNTFIVRKESDIDAIGRAINRKADRQRRAAL